MRKIIVPPQLPLTFPAKIFFLGEAPSDVEEALLVPFTGPIGKLHNRILRAAGIDRAEAYTDNTLNFKLPRNKVEGLTVPKTEVLGYEGPWKDHVLSPVSSGGYLRPEIVVENMDRIRDGIQASGANIVIALGALATWAMTGLPGHGVIMRTRGTIRYSHAEMGSVKTLLTYHPGFIRRNFKFWPLAVIDYHVALMESESPKIEVPTLDIVWPRDREHAEKLMKARLFNADPLVPISVDIETRHGGIDCIGFTDQPLRALVIPIYDEVSGLPYFKSLEDEVIVRSLVNDFLSGPHPKTFQNGSYDVQWIWEKWKIKTRNYLHDTRLIHHALWPELPKDLANMAATHTNLPAWKPIRGKRPKKED